MRRRPWWTAALLLASAAAAPAESWRTTKTVCDAGFHPKTTQPPPGTTAAPGGGFHSIEECFIDLFTLDPVGPAVGNIGTGGGFGGGVHVKVAPTANQIFTAKGLYSTNSSYVGMAQYRFVLRPWRPIMIGGPHGQTDDTRGNLDFHVERLDLRKQDFYGLGPDSTRAGHAVYRDIETSAGVNGYMPLPYLSSSAGIVGVLGEARFLRPVIKGVTGDTLPSVIKTYSEAGAPGEMARPDFGEFGLGASIRTPTAKPVEWEEHEGEFMFRHYGEKNSSDYSFNQVEGWANVGLTMLKHAKSSGRWNTSSFEDQSRWKDALCMPQQGGSCELAQVTFRGRVTASYTGSGSTVPFYLQPTLGGADFDGIDTLRGLVDYRLRAPNRLLFQVDLDKPIAQIGVKGHPLGQYGLYTFFDAGTVALTPGTLVENALRKDIGVGFSIAIQNKVVLRAYIAFGAGEGSHPNVKMASAF